MPSGFKSMQEESVKETKKNNNNNSNKQSKTNKQTKNRIASKADAGN